MRPNPPPAGPRGKRQLMAIPYNLQTPREENDEQDDKPGAAAPGLSMMGLGGMKEGLRGPSQKPLRETKRASRFIRGLLGRLPLPFFHPPAPPLRNNLRDQDTEQMMSSLRRGTIGKRSACRQMADD